jgi:hypothetical protein
MLETWITGLAEMVRTWDLVVVVGPDGSMVSMGSINNLENAGMREVSTLTRTLAVAVRRRDPQAFVAVLPQIQAMSEEQVLRWCSLLGRLVAWCVVQLEAPAEYNPNTRKDH